MNQGTIENPVLIEAPDIINAPGISQGNRPGTATVDRTGIVSTSQFNTAGTDTTDDTFTGTSWQSFIGGTLTLTIPRNAIVLMVHTGRGSVTSASIGEQQIFVGTAAIPTTTYAPPLRFDSTTEKTESLTIITTTLFSGTQNFVLRGRVASGAGTFVVPNGQFGVIVLGR